MDAAGARAQLPVARVTAWHLPELLQARGYGTEPRVLRALLAAQQISWSLSKCSRVLRWAPERFDALEDLCSAFDCSLSELITIDKLPSTWRTPALAARRGRKSSLAALRPPPPGEV